MNFWQLQPMNGQDGKPAWQPCDPVQVLSVNPQGKPYGMTNYYQMSVQGAQGPTNASMSGKSPLTPGTHPVVCKVRDGQYGRDFTFKRAPKDDFGGGGYAPQNTQSYGQPSTVSPQGTDIQTRITWNSAVNNACNLLALKGGEQDFAALKRLAGNIYDVIMEGPPTSAPADNYPVQTGDDEDIPF